MTAPDGSPGLIFIITAGLQATQCRDIRMFISALGWEIEVRLPEMWAPEGRLSMISISLCHSPIADVGNSRLFTRVNHLIQFSRCVLIGNNSRERCCLYVMIHGTGKENKFY
jgi:hypothetical protein